MAFDFSVSMMHMTSESDIFQWNTCLKILLSYFYHIQGQVEITEC
jgi:hypothetical protein